VRQVVGSFGLEMLDVEELKEVEVKEGSQSLEELCGLGGNWKLAKIRIC
jgi:hypothetical protein